MPLTLCLNAECLNPRVRAMSPAGLGLYPLPVPAVTSSSVSTSVTGGLNAAATELARLGDRAAAVAASVVSPPGLAPWSLSPFTAVGVDTDRASRLDRVVADESNKNFGDYVNKQRCVEQPFIHD